MAPPSARQFASPTLVKFSIPLSPSISVVQPPPGIHEGIDEHAASMPPATRTSSAFILPPLLLPGAVVDGVFVRGPGNGHVPLHRPVVRIVEALARIGLRRGVQEAPSLQLLGLEEPAGLAREVMG